MTVRIWFVSQELEDLLAGMGMPTRCLVHNTAEDKAQIQVVFPQNRELDLSNFLEQLSQSRRDVLDRLFPRGAQFEFRTVLYHFSNDIFSEIPRRGGPFVSTNVVNLHDPRKRDGNGSTKGIVLEYDVDLVLVYQDVPTFDHAQAEERARTIAVRFNRVSRYLKIAQLRIAHTAHRAILPGEPKPVPHPVALE